MALGLLVTAGCDQGSSPKSDAAVDRQAAAAVVMGLRPDSSRGFDAASWADATDPAKVIPAGGRVVPDAKSWDIREKQATVDVSLRVPGQPAQRHWLFLHKVDGKWLVYGSFPLDQDR